MQLNLIRRIVEASGLRWKEISRKYFIWPSPLSRIKCMHESESELHPIWKTNFKRMVTWKKLNTKFGIIINKTKWICCCWCSEGFILNFGISWSLKSISNEMKKDLNLTFKKWTSRPNNINQINEMRWMLAIEFAQCPKKNLLIWNIDEWVISQKTKSNYSWSIKGSNKEIKDEMFSNSINLILVIFSNGYWYCLKTNDTIDSALFWHFLKKLNGWIIKN